MNYLNCLKHSVFTPETYNRRYEQDLVGVAEEGLLPDRLRRTALSVLPFIALYRPAGFALSVGMGSCRVISHLSVAILKAQEGQWNQAGGQLLLLSLAVTAVASTVFSFGVGLFVTTLVDTSQSLLHTIEHVWVGEYDKGLEELLQMLSSGLYLGFMATGTLEVILLSTLIQGLISLYQSRQEIQKGHYIEAGAKVLLAGVRGHQVLQYRQMIQRRDFLFSLKKYQNLIARAMKGRQVRHLIQNGQIELPDSNVKAKAAISQIEKKGEDPLAFHPLANLAEEIDQKRVIIGECDFASHFHGYGKGVVKGANLTFRTVLIDGKQMTELEFKVNHVAKRHLEQTLDDLERTLGNSGSLQEKEIQQVLLLAGSHATNISLERQGSVDGFCNFSDYGEEPVAKLDLAPIRKLTLEGLGSISIGATTLDEGSGPGYIPNLFPKVVVRMPPGATLCDFHEIMAFADLDSSLCVSTPEDMDRLKLGHLFRTFFPREAFPLERDELFFDLSIPELKQTMIQRAPEMQEVFDRYFSRMTPVEILPGRVRYGIEGLSDEVRDLGMAHLTAAITGPQEDEILFSRVASMLSMGMISTELRDNYGVNASGLGPVVDYLGGGADSVYTQLMPNEFAKGDKSLADFSFYSSRMRILISLRALETGTYQYTTGGLGNRWDFRDFFKNESFYSAWEFQEWEEISYAHRLNILEFAKKLDYSKGNWRAHEVMLKERVDPSYFEGLLVEDEMTKQGLLAYLRSCGLVKRNSEGAETILNTLIDQFIRVATGVNG